MKNNMKTEEIPLYKQRVKKEDVSLKQMKIINILEEHGPLKRGTNYNNGNNTLLNLTGIPRTTLYDNLEKLEIKGIVKREKKHKGTRGRPNEYWSLIKQNGGQK
jgi:DNA-binding MarR family transcriptional regulator